MFMKFLSLEFKNFTRSPQFAAGIAMKILTGFMLVYFAAIFFGGAFALYFICEEEGENPLQIFSRFFIFYWIVDLLIKYIMQQLPTNNIKPFLTMPISKNKIVGYTVTKILTSFFSWAFLIFMIPFTILLLTNGSYNPLGIIGLFITTVSLILINACVNTFINKSNALLYSLIGIGVTLGVLQYLHYIDISKFSENIFLFFYNHPLGFVIPLLLCIALCYVSFQFIKKNLYLDKGLEMKKTVGKTENIEFLNRFGSVGTFLNNDIKLIKRSKAARGALIMGFVFLLYGFITFSGGTYKSPFMQLIIGLIITGGFNLTFGQRVPAWDSSYYPLMMTSNVPYKDYLKGKWAMFLVITSISMILAVAYGFFISWDFYLTVLAAGLYNLGVNSYLTLFAGAYNKKPIDLNSSSKGFTSGQNNFNVKLLLVVIPQMILPMVVFGVMKLFFGIYPAVFALGVLGLLGFLFRDKIFDLIVKVYKEEKYSTISAFKKVD